MSWAIFVTFISTCLNCTSKLGNRWYFRGYFSPGLLPHFKRFEILEEILGDLKPAPVIKNLIKKVLGV